MIKIRLQKQNMKTRKSNKLKQSKKMTVLEISKATVNYKVTGIPIVQTTKIKTMKILITLTRNNWAMVLNNKPSKFKRHSSHS